MGQLLLHLASVWTTSLVLCAETSYLETEAAAVGQVILNRVRSRLFPPSILEVVVQRRQFAAPGRCRLQRGELREFHWTTSQRMHRNPGKRMRSWRIVRERTLAFMTLPRWRQHRRRWKKSGWRLEGTSRKPNGKVAHVWLWRDLHGSRGRRRGR